MHVRNMKLNRIYNEDCIRGMKKIPNNNADIIIVDPPYNVGKDFGNDSDKQKHVDYIEWVKLWLLECQRLLKPTGTMFIYGFDEILAHISVLLPMEHHRWLTWYYTNKNVPSLHFWQRSHESILCYWRDNPIFNRDEVREPYTEGFLKGSAGRVRPKSTSARFGGKETVYNANRNGALPRDVIRESTLAGGASLKERIIYCKTCEKIITPTERKLHEKHDLIIHPTQKPLSLTDKLLKSCRPNKNDYTVIIPFCGSGSECISALQNNGSYIAYEINPDYILLAEKNIQQFIAKRNL
ncbi:MAG: site-specific DNA-methyltransferase [Endomicrobium sp.]|nr:site-specific DNA-methyltransferase [Endomicrobium sp.]